MLRKIFIFICCSGLLSLPAWAQDLSQRLAQAMEQKRANNYFAGARAFVNDMVATPDRLMELLPLYGQDSSALVREFTCELYAFLHEKTTDNQIKQVAIERLGTALSDSVQDVRTAAATALNEIPAGEFSDKVKHLIVISFSAYGPLDGEQVLLAGHLHLTELTGILQQFKNNPAQDNDVRWRCYLVLARMGDESSLNFILAAVQKRGVNDRVVYNDFPDLIYTRQRKIFDYLIKELFSDEQKCHSPNPSIAREMVCGYRIMEMLASVIKDFPLSVTAAGTINTKNYDSALEKARKWLKQHETDYEILM
jgi:HEAT repeat protein